MATGEVHDVLERFFFFPGFAQCSGCDVRMMESVLGHDCFGK